MSRKNAPRAVISLIGLSCAFTLAGLTFAHNLGIEADEAIIASGIYGHGQPLYSWRIGSFDIPVMLMSYVGGLKTWIWNFYFLFFRPNAVTLRFPAILIGVASLWLLFAFVDRIAGRLAAWTGTLLLASDPVYLLLVTTDFGFVALQFLLKLSAILLLLRFHRRGSLRALAGAFLLFGLALWDKAVFVWVLFGLASATICLFPDTLRKYLTKKNYRHCSDGLCTGCITAGDLQHRTTDGNTAC